LYNKVTSITISITITITITITIFLIIIMQVISLGYYCSLPHRYCIILMLSFLLYLNPEIAVS
jgi:hypothetical protein